MSSARFLSAGVVVLTVALVGAWPAAGQAAVIVRAVPSAATVSVGDGFDVQLRADLDSPVLGWGLDLGFDGSILGRSAVLTIGPAWQSVCAADNDGLAGMAFPAAVTGNDVLLATVHFTAISAGQTNLMISKTTGDLTEGFPLDPIDFAEVQFVPAAVTVVPEPVTLFLVALGILVVGRRSCRA